MDVRSDGPDSHGSNKTKGGRRTDVESQRFFYSDESKLGVFSTAFLIINKMIGAGIFTVPATVFRATGSVGVSLLLWLLGGVLALCGLSVYLSFGLALPYSGGEKNYLERVYRRPKHLTTCVLAAQMVLLGFSAGNAVACGQLIVDACRSSGAAAAAARESWAARGIGLACVSFAALLHGALPRWGVRLMNLVGVFKVLVMLVVAFSGVAALAGYRGTDDPHNFEHSFSAADMARYGSGEFRGYAGALLGIVYSFGGWEGANYVLGEVRNPRRTLAIAAPLAVGTVTVLYMLANIAYFAAVRKLDIAASEVLVAALFFKNMFGDDAAAKTLPVFVAVSSLGSVLATSFAHARLNQELGKERILPFGRFWASNKPLNAPAAALFLHWLVTVIVLVAPPLGQSYEAIIELSVYPRAWINLLLTVGLIYLQWNKAERWKSPWHTYLPISVVFLLLNGFLIIGPFIPPSAASISPDSSFLFPLLGLAVLMSGVLYWAVWIKLVPRLRGYRIESERVFGRDEVVQYRRVKC
ncbi:Amino acid polyamine transporter I [Cordyceps militaris]|uniref:Amino acid polyamine transporter I n=1 Tax=Cordyceps militaris TaxID=73501 RepID=A0A2H4SST6_CORMI|nr:Amino acid polyamine transporter I [Cordyceps militaris]